MITKCKTQKQLRLQIRSMTYNALHHKNNDKYIKGLGCTVGFLKQHIQNLFTEGMNWGNYGYHEGQWSIDHITLLASFDLNDPQQYKTAAHYTNLRPLWHVDNISQKYN